MQATSKPERWRKCVMDSLSAATAAELGEVSFRLPGEPLAATLALLLAASRELQRAGGPQLPPLARQCLAGELQVLTARKLLQFVYTCLRDLCTLSLAHILDQGVGRAGCTATTRQVATGAATVACMHDSPRCGC